MAHKRIDKCNGCGENSKIISDAEKLTGGTVEVGLCYTCDRSRCKCGKLLRDPLATKCPKCGARLGFYE